MVSLSDSICSYIDAKDRNRPQLLAETLSRLAAVQTVAAR
jgi:hypothetical protein